jgi:hypothetical protein
MGMANVVTFSASNRGRRCPFNRYTGCTEDHTAAACKDFRTRDAETKRKALEESELCMFCLRHAAGSECYGSKPACQAPECDGQHTEKLHEMMAGLNASVNMVVDEEEEGGYVNVARGKQWEENAEEWDTPDDSWLEMEAIEKEEEGIFYVNVLTNEREEEEQDGEQEEEELGQGCVCQGQASSTEDKDEDCTRRIASIRRRLKRKRPDSEEARWKSIRRNAWLRELLSSSSGEEEEQEEKRAKLENKIPSRFKESARWMAEANLTGWLRLERQLVDPDPAEEDKTKDADKVLDEMEDENPGLVKDKITEALVLLDERTRAIGERLVQIESRLKELDSEESEKSREKVVTRRVQICAPRLQVQNGKSDPGTGNFGFDNVSGECGS